MLNTDQILAYGQLLISDEEFSSTLDDIASVALGRLADLADGDDLQPTLHLFYRHDDGQREHHMVIADMPPVSLKYRYYQAMGYTLGSSAQHRLAACYFTSCAWFSTKPGILPEDDPARSEVCIVSGLTFDLQRHNQFAAHYVRDTHGRPHVDRQQTQHYGVDSPWTLSANRLLVKFIQGFAAGVLGKPAPSTAPQI